MPRPRVFLESLPPPGEPVRLSAEEASHVRARRLRPGDGIVLFDGTGREARGRVARASRAAVEVVADDLAARAAEEASVTLYVAAVRAERLAWTVEKAVELGVTRIEIVRAERSQGFRASAALADRLARVARAAAKQIGAARAPEISGPVPAPDAFAREPAPRRLLLDAAGAPFPASLPPGDAALAIGPEGGWTASERSRALAAGWTAARLPAGALRAETAAVAGLVLLRAALARGAA